MGYHKPTRFQLKTGLAFPDFVHEGLPTFDKQGCYMGPLPSTAAAQWPSKMAEWRAQLC